MKGDFEPYCIGKSENGTVRALWLQVGTKPFAAPQTRLEMPPRSSQRYVKDLEEENRQLKAQNAFMVETIRQLRLKKDA